MFFFFEKNKLSKYLGRDFFSVYFEKTQKTLLKKETPPPASKCFKCLPFIFFNEEF